MSSSNSMNLYTSFFSPQSSKVLLYLSGTPLWWTWCLHLSFNSGVYGRWGIPHVFIGNQGKMVRNLWTMMDTVSRLPPRWLAKRLAFFRQCQRCRFSAWTDGDGSAKDLSMMIYGHFADLCGPCSTPPQFKAWTSIDLGDDWDCWVKSKDFPNWRSSVAWWGGYVKHETTVDHHLN